MVNEMSLKELKAELALERERSKLASEKLALRQELRDLREKANPKTSARLKRGFKVLARKAAISGGKGIRKAVKFARESGAGEGLEDLKFESALPPRGRTRAARVSTTPRKRRRRKGRATVRTRIVRTTTIRRKARKKPKRRAVRRRAPVRRQESEDIFDGGFF